MVDKAWFFLKYSLFTHLYFFICRALRNFLYKMYTMQKVHLIFIINVIYNRLKIFLENTCINVVTKVAFFS